jgi:hypothetical protein
MKRLVIILSVAFLVVSCYSGEEQTGFQKDESFIYEKGGEWEVRNLLGYAHGLTVEIVPKHEVTKLHVNKYTDAFIWGDVSKIPKMHICAVKAVTIAIHNLAPYIEYGNYKIRISGNPLIHVLVYDWDERIPWVCMGDKCATNWHELNSRIGGHNPEGDTFTAGLGNGYSYILAQVMMDYIETILWVLCHEDACHLAAGLLHGDECDVATEIAFRESKIVMWQIPECIGVMNDPNNRKGTTVYWDAQMLYWDY